MMQFSSPSPSRTFEPSMSSPLAMPPSSPITTIQARRSGQYKARTVSSSSAPRAGRPAQFRLPPASGASSSPDKEPTATRLMRGRLLAKCEQQRRQDRERRRTRSLPSSSDGEGSSDAEMGQDGRFGFDDDDEEETDLVGRIMATEHRRAQHRMARSFEYEVGSSPGVPEDLLEELAYEEPPELDPDFEAMYNEYMHDMQAAEQAVDDSESPDMDMSGDFEDPVPATPPRQVIRRRYNAVSHDVAVLQQCPACNTQQHIREPLSQHHTCASCNLTFAPEAVLSSWHIDHSSPTPSGHRPVVMQLPDGYIMLCSSDGCEWCLDL